MSSKVLSFTVILFIGFLFSKGLAKEKRQAAAASDRDPEPAETGFANAAISHGSKYFQYIHVPEKDHYEHGHKRGNEHHFIERHEKAHPHEGEFKTKVRWGDKHGGYGEHYWDYNHAGHDHDGEESQNNEEYAAYEETKQVPSIASNQRDKRQQQFNDEDVEFISDVAKESILSGKGQKHGGNYRRAKEYRAKREEENGEDLIFDRVSGNIYNQKTGRQYQLKLIDS